MSAMVSVSPAMKRARQMLSSIAQQGSVAATDARSACAALFGRRADQLHEGVAAGRVERGLLPVHPALGVEALRRSCG
jgi:hypothetical protein